MGERCVARTHAKECIPLLMSSVLPLTPMCTVGQRQPPGSRGRKKGKGNVRRANTGGLLHVPVLGQCTQRGRHDRVKKNKSER